MSDKEIIDGANTLALQYFTTYNRMLQLTGNSEEAIRLTSSLFEAMLQGIGHDRNHGRAALHYTGIGGKTIDRAENEAD